MPNIELAQIILQLCTYQPNKQPPLTLEQFQAFEAALECSLPDDIKQLYLEHDGHEPQKYHSMFLMSSHDALEVYDHIKQREEWWWIFPNLTDNIRYLWHDADGNFAGLYVSGPLAEKIVFNNHENPSPKPIFRSVMSFYRSTFELSQSTRWDWSEMITDYPVIGEIMSDDAADDLAVALSCLQHWDEANDSDEFRGWASCVIALLPPKETGRLLKYFNSVGFHHCKTEIMDLFTKRRYEPAIEWLADWLPKELGYSQQSVFRTIGTIGGNEAGKAIISLKDKISQNAILAARDALQKCGYQVREVESGYEYHAPNETSWHKL